MASITIVADGQEQKYNLEAETVTLGRGLESDIRLKDIKASRRHCQIIRTPAGFQCLDLSSGNGTFINGVQIKQQKLNPGDKIQIGSTLITFHDGAAQKAASQAKAATAKVPATAAAATAKAAPRGAATTSSLPKAGAPPKPATGKIPTGAVPAATKKITAKIDVAKAQTQAMNPARPSTGGVPRATTTSLKKTTGRVPSTRSMGPASATQRFHAEARRKKTSPVALLIGGIAVIFLLVIGFIFFWPSEDIPLLQAQIANYDKEGDKLDSEGKIDPAIAAYKKALAVAESTPKLKDTARTLRTKIQNLESAKAALAAVEAKFNDFRAKFESNTVKARDLWDQGNALKREVGEAQVPWKAKFLEMLEKVDRLLQFESDELKKMDFQVYRNSVSEKYKLDRESIRAGKADWSGAFQAWKAYVEKITNEDSKRKAEGEINRLHLQAKEEIGLMRRRAERQVGEGKKDEAIRDLDEAMARFKGIEAEAELKKVIEDIRK